MATPFPFVADAILTAAQLNAITELPVATKTASYVLVAADSGYRIIMNLGTATTITVNTGLFVAGQVVRIHNQGAGVCTITAGTATVTTTGSLALAQWGGGLLYFTSASAAIFFPFGGGVSYGTATGGTSSSITVSGVNYTMLVFNSTANLEVTTAGLFDFILGGGGGGGFPGETQGGGGGGGQIRQATVYLPIGTHAITIAAGGVSDATSPRLPGGVTALASTLTAVGGAQGSQATVGASGGGANAGNNTGSPALLSGVTGFKGGDNTGVASAGGGGGFGAVGENRAASPGGAGGTGFDASAWRGEAANTTRIAGGGGGSGTVGGAGTDGGGNGGSSATGTAGSANRCGGGGGGSTTGGAGGTGVAYVRFKI